LSTLGSDDPKVNPAKLFIPLGQQAEDDLKGPDLDPLGVDNLLVRQVSFQQDLPGARLDRGKHYFF
jgi:hypothetical protein